VGQNENDVHLCEPAQNTSVFQHFLESATELKQEQEARSDISFQVASDFPSVSIIQIIRAVIAPFIAFTVRREFVFELLMIYSLFISDVSKSFIKKQV
jgi:hypothetical protein